MITPQAAVREGTGALDDQHAVSGQGQGLRCHTSTGTGADHDRVVMRTELTRRCRRRQLRLNRRHFVGHLTKADHGEAIRPGLVLTSIGCAVPGRVEAFPTQSEQSSEVGTESLLLGGLPQNTVLLGGLRHSKASPLELIDKPLHGIQSPSQLGAALGQVFSDTTLPAPRPFVGRDDPVDRGPKLGRSGDLEPPSRCARPAFSARQMSLPMSSPRSTCQTSSPPASDPSPPPNRRPAPSGPSQILVASHDRPGCWNMSSERHPDNPTLMPSKSAGTPGRFWPPRGNTPAARIHRLWAAGAIEERTMSFVASSTWRPWG